MMMMIMNGSESCQVVKLGKEKILACLTCPICHKLFVDATTISECLHTFCRKCIYEKIGDEELDHCPVCNTNLGCVPLDKLRLDHNLQDLRYKIFPFETKTGKETNAVPSAPLPAKRKERSLSSLVITAPRASPQHCLNGRIKYPARKNLVRQESIPLDHKPVKKDEDPPEEVHDIEVNGKQISANGSCKQQGQNDNVENSVKTFEGKDDMWKPLNSLVETISKTNANKAKLQETIHADSVMPNGLKSEVHEPKARVKKLGKRSRAHGGGEDTTPEPSAGSVKSRKTLRRRRVSTTSDGVNVPAQRMEVANREFGRRFSPIWFSLIASNEQQGDAPLPQISSCYLRVKDGSFPVSLVKKYLAKKLGLGSEAEVEISLRGQPVSSTIELHNLVDLWTRTAPLSEMIRTSVGSSGKDFVMLLSYGRKSSALA